MKKHAIGQSGFTLLELVVIVVIISLMGVVALPELHKTREKYRLKAAAVDILSYFQCAKMEAVKRSTSVSIAFTEGTSGKLTMFIDDGAGGGTAENMIRDGSEEILRDVSMPKGVTLTSGFSFGTDSAGFDSRGLSLSGRTGSVLLENFNEDKYRVYLSSVTGSVRLEKES